MMATLRSPASTSPLRSKSNARQSVLERSFRPDIEGLRAIAVLLVLLDHAGIAAFSGGYVGVDVFFVLSGFLITGILLKEHERTGRLSLARFYARRARRLLPAGSLVLIVTVLTSYLVLGENRANRVADDARWAALFASNIHFGQQGTDYLNAQLPPSPLQHYWSLAVEEQFYAVWPAVILLLAMLGRRWSLRSKLAVVLGLVIVGSLVYSARLTESNATTAYFSPFPRAFEMAAGALLAVFGGHLSKCPRPLGIGLSWVGLAAIVAAALRFDHATAFPGIAVSVPVMGTMLAVAGGTVTPGRGAEVFLRLAPFQWVGRLSYSVYLWHWPILVIVASWAGRALTVGENLALCGFAMVISALTFAALEDPVRDSPYLKRRTPAVSVGMGAALIAICLAVSSGMISSHRVRGEVLSGELQQTAFPSSSAVLVAVADAVDVTEWPPQPERIDNRLIATIATLVARRRHRRRASMVIQMG